MARYVEAVSRPCTWGNSLLGTDTLSQCLYEHFSLHLQHRKFKVVCVLVTTLLGTNSSPLKNGWFYITTFPSDWGFGPIFSGGKTCPVSGRVHKKTIHTLAPLVTPRWSRWVLHSQQVRRGWEQFWAPSTLVPGTDTLDTYPTWGKRNMIFNSSFLRDMISFKECSFFTATYCH